MLHELDGALDFLYIMYGIFVMPISSSIYGMRKQIHYLQ